MFLMYLIIVVIKWLIELNKLSYFLIGILPINTTRAINKANVRYDIIELFN